MRCAGERGDVTRACAMLKRGNFDSGARGPLSTKRGNKEAIKHYFEVFFNQKMSRYRFALVSWAKGPDKDTTSIVPISWIIDFDPADTDKTYFVECRSTNHKKPASGWPIEHAFVLQLAGKSIFTHSHTYYSYFLQVIVLADTATECLFRLSIKMCMPLLTILQYSITQICVNCF